MRRTDTKLLRQVKGKPHASDENHEPDPELLPRKSRKQHIEKIYPSPTTTASGNSSQVPVVEVASDDEPISDDDLPTVSSAWGKLVDYEKPKPCTIDAVEAKEVSKNKSTGAKDSKQDQKRRSSFDEEDEPEWMGSSQPKSKKQKVIAPRTNNIHAPAGVKYGGQPVKGYGSASQRKQHRHKRDEARKKEKEKDGFRTAKRIELEEVKSPTSGFKAPQVDTFSLIASGSINDSFLSAIPRAERADLDDIESLSDLDEKAISTIEEGKQYLPLPKPYVSTHKCEHCQEEVEKLLYEEFVDQYSSGRDLNFKWQRRFCTHHKKHKAEALWKERGYPTIDWSGLERRMKKHDTFLRSILKHEQESIHRQTLQRQLAPGRRAKNISQMLTNRNVKAGTLVGYYGPRGQKAIADHIIDNLSDDIREQAIHDKLILTSGAQGGVSGFVQSVLVPHLAEMLIKEDLYLTVDWEVEVREVIADSGELGELMYPETEDEIKEVDDDE